MSYRYIFAISSQGATPDGHEGEGVISTATQHVELDEEFPSLPDELGEEECALDALFSPPSSRLKTPGDDYRRRLEEERDAWRLLQIW